MVWDVTQHFLSFWRQIDAIHRNLITFVLLCLEWFERNWKFLIVLTSYRCNSSWFEHFCFARSNHSKHSKTTKVIKLRWIASIWRLNDQKCWVTYQTIPNTGKLQKCIGLTSKRSKMLSYVPNHSKHSKTRKMIKSRWISSIWRLNDQKCWVTSQTIPNTAKLQKCSNHNELYRFDVKTIKNVELRPKPFQTQQNYKSDQITMNCNDLTSKRSKMLSYVQTIPNTAKLQKWSNYDELHRFDV